MHPDRSGIRLGPLGNHRSLPVRVPGESERYAAGQTKGKNPLSSSLTHPMVSCMSVIPTLYTQHWAIPTLYTIHGHANTGPYQRCTLSQHYTHTGPYQHCTLYTAMPTLYTATTLDHTSTIHTALGHANTIHRNTGSCQHCTHSTGPYQHCNYTLGHTASRLAVSLAA
jgi:hypothetical protein